MGILRNTHFNVLLKISSLEGDTMRKHDDSQTSCLHCVQDQNEASTLNDNSSVPVAVVGQVRYRRARLSLQLRVGRVGCHRAEDSGRTSGRTSLKRHHRSNASTDRY